MSGGSLNYLYNKTTLGEIAENINNIKEVEEEMLKRGYKDIAMDARRLIEYIRSAENRIECLTEKLAPVFKAVEWYYSADSDEKNVDEAVERYRNENRISIGEEIAKGIESGFKLENLGVRKLKKEMQEREELKRLIKDTIREELEEEKKEQKYIVPTETLLRQCVKILNDYCKSNNSCEYCILVEGEAANRCELNDEIRCGNISF
ncbi:hypothetical protein [uncultured Robinsoniella sp.]|uniref:hypothetical protein n=1 Tax=uncultured Robinsoniella sp. TaxID=904190 RepID=UPI002912436D|nr:hypothetical protein [Clostridiales bacterium]